MSAALTQQLTTLNNRYRARFAGHPRLSRDADELREMIGELETIESDVKKAKDSELSDNWSQTVDLFKNELLAVNEAQGAGAAAIAAHRITNWANFTIARYQRNFAGQNRTTRDPGLLDQLLEDVRLFRAELEKVHKKAPTEATERDLGILQNSIDAYVKEAAAIRASILSGGLGDQATRLATAANHQFDQYREQFAGKSRISRNPRTLERIIANLQEIRTNMETVSTRGIDSEPHLKNIGIVNSRLEAYEAELKAVRAARSTTAPLERMNALGTAANDIFAEYREHFAGKDRKTRDLGLLNRILERLHPVAREMDDLDKLHDNEQNARNLSLVTDQIRMYGREYEAIKTAMAS